MHMVPASGGDLVTLSIGDKTWRIVAAVEDVEGAMAVVDAL